MFTILFFMYAFGCGFNLAWCLYDYKMNPETWQGRTLQMSVVYTVLWTIGSFPAFLFDALELKNLFD